MSTSKADLIKKFYEIECEAGEAIFDEMIEINPPTFMFWCLGKKYITNKNVDIWYEDWRNNKLEAIDSNYYIHGDEVYSIVNSDEDYSKAVDIFCEFCSEIIVYTNRLNKLYEEVCGNE